MIEQIYITTQGRRLWALGQTGVEVHFTRVQVGDGKLQAGQDITQLTALIHPRKYVPIAAKEVIDSMVSIGIQITNADQTEEIMFREIGIWANDPDVGEILYAVGNAGDKAELIPKPDVQRIDYQLALMLSMGNASNISFEYQPSMIFATKVEVGLIHDDVTLQLQAQNVAIQQQLAAQDTRINEEIDEAIYAVRDRQRTLVPQPITLLADPAMWQPFASPYTSDAYQQTLMIPGLTVADGFFIGYLYKDKEIRQSAGLSALETTVDGQLTFVCATLPESDITVIFTRVEVNP